ncbi:uncharacterized protein BDV17DRAFT_291709 [Aspergillus undulatus]|uniref:uncharacterized protein n=1 Tax=Aspergillus undulatus TaxID=1810928 RepID=UPI003CCCE20F
MSKTTYYALVESRDASPFHTLTYPFQQSTKSGLTFTQRSILGCGDTRFLLSTTDITAIDDWSNKMADQGIERLSETEFTFSQEYVDYVKDFFHLKIEVESIKRISHGIGPHYAAFKKMFKSVQRMKMLENRLDFEALDRDYVVILYHSDELDPLFYENPRKDISRFRIVAPNKDVFVDWFLVQQKCEAGVHIKTDYHCTYNERKLNILRSDEKFPELERFRGIIRFEPID